MYYSIINRHYCESESVTLLHWCIFSYVTPQFSELWFSTFSLLVDYVPFLIPCEFVFHLIIGFFFVFTNLTNTVVFVNLIFNCWFLLTIYYTGLKWVVSYSLRHSKQLSVDQLGWQTFTLPTWLSQTHSHGLGLPKLVFLQYCKYTRQSACHCQASDHSLIYMEIILEGCQLWVIGLLL